MKSIYTENSAHCAAERRCVRPTRSCVPFVTRGAKFGSSPRPAHTPRYISAFTVGQLNGVFVLWCSLLLMSIYRWACCLTIMAQCCLRCSWQCGVSFVCPYYIPILVLKLYCNVNIQIFAYESLIGFMAAIKSHEIGKIHRNNWKSGQSVQKSLFVQLPGCLTITEARSAKEMPHRLSSYLNQPGPSGGGGGRAVIYCIRTHYSLGYSVVF